MRAYSIDIRERVIENLDQESMRKTAKRFRVSGYFVYRLKRRYKEAGTLAPKPHGGGHGPIVDEGGGEFIADFRSHITLVNYTHFSPTLALVSNPCYKY